MKWIQNTSTQAITYTVSVRKKNQHFARVPKQILITFLIAASFFEFTLFGGDGPLIEGLSSMALCANAQPVSLISGIWRQEILIGRLT